MTGRVWYNPLTESVYEFPTYVQTVDYPKFTVNAKDGSIFDVDPTLSFKVKDNHSPDIFKKYRKDIEVITKTTLFNYIRDAFRIEFNKYSTDSIISNREMFENAVQKHMQMLLDKEGFQLEQMTSGILYPESITQAINAKNAAIQQAMRVENELKVAQAQARKLMVLAEAEAKANELRKQSLNQLLIQQQFIEKWDGKTPIYGQAPSFSNLLINRFLVSSRSLTDFCLRQIISYCYSTFLFSFISSPTQFPDCPIFSSPFLKDIFI